MVAAARERGLFLMEAMWTRFLPSYQRLIELLFDGRIGEPLLVEGDFGFAPTSTRSTGSSTRPSAEAPPWTWASTPSSCVPSCWAAPTASPRTSPSVRPASTNSRQQFCITLVVSSAWSNRRSGSACPAGTHRGHRGLDRHPYVPSLSHPPGRARIRGTRAHRHIPRGTASASKCTRSTAASPPVRQRARSCRSTNRSRSPSRSTSSDAAAPQRFRPERGAADGRSP